MTLVVGTVVVNGARREGPQRRVVIVHRQRDLLDVVLALQVPRRLPRRLHRRQQQGNQSADDGDDHQKLDERERRFRILDFGWLVNMGCSSWPK